MILTDKDIKAYTQQGMLITENFAPDNVGSISYDLTIDKILVHDEEDSFNEDSIVHKDSYYLGPGEYVIIKTRELLSIPTNIIGRIADKNSLIRLGLNISGPHYQPGHTTYAYLRVHNISCAKIKISKGQKIAQIIFEELKGIPDVPYNKDDSASFNDELEYRGFGKYSNIYAKNKEKIIDMTEELSSKVNGIYGNVLTLMGIFISIFAMISINFQIFSNGDMTTSDLLKTMIVINTSLALVISFLMGLIVIITDSKKSKQVLKWLSMIIVILSITGVSLFLIISNSNTETTSVEESQTITLENIQVEKENSQR